jgi:hypothetical protein
MMLTRNGAAVNRPISCISSFIVLTFKAIAYLFSLFKDVFSLKLVEFPCDKADKSQLP